MQPGRRAWFWPPSTHSKSWCGRCEGRKLAAYITAAEREAFLEAFSATVELVEVKERLALCRDPHDDKFLELAVAGGADYLITGDADLLVMERFRTTAILAPAAFLEQARGAAS